MVMKSWWNPLNLTNNNDNFINETISLSTALWAEHRPNSAARKQKSWSWGCIQQKKNNKKKEEAQNSLDSIIKELMAVKMKHLNALMEAEQSPAEGLSWVWGFSMGTAGSCRAMIQVLTGTSSTKYPRSWLKLSWKPFCVKRYVQLCLSVRLHALRWRTPRSSCPHNVLCHHNLVPTNQWCSLHLVYAPDSSGPLHQLDHQTWHLHLLTKSLSANSTVTTSDCYPRMVQVSLVVEVKGNTFKFPPIVI